MFVEKTAFSWISAQSRAEYIWRSTFWRCFMARPVDWRRKKTKQILHIFNSTWTWIAECFASHRSVKPSSQAFEINAPHNLLTTTSNFQQTQLLLYKCWDPAFNCFYLFLPCSLPIHSRLPECLCCRRGPIRAILHKSPSTRCSP